MQMKRLEPVIVLDFKRVISFFGLICVELMMKEFNLQLFDSIPPH